MSKRFQDVISTHEQFAELRQVYGHPGERAVKKVISSLDHHCREFISKSPFLALATSNADGECDVSPRGDHPGFVLVLDDHHLFIPERPGNRRLDSVQNILSNPQVGLLFLIPGLGETLRINGKAFVCRDQELLDQCAVNGRRPLFGIGVEVKECFAHCAKALIRSSLWDPEKWLAKELLPFMPQVYADHCQIPEMTTERVEKELNEGYQNRLY
ncbi:pyridoxamine 5'-phosphate oxidase family protein [Brevibacillus brevis]|uniref:Pyridoxamine 5'-phosphate oxidase family protein n=1 Tax=Brevibacillus brevis TaxID=1393 RepID=A0ABY9T954_BREBE|nr:pyridoxamine 5'-phosphate oxidase family protein [Brevibacillus brevis]WNC16412.1 pyridoxamine 5'-phosphate oxidase family protein [Brevibacillus brevis]